MTRAQPALDVRLLADDLTGALDSAAAFEGSVPVYLDAAPLGHPGGVAAVATPTRDVAPGRLPDKLAGVLAWFVAGGLAFKKVDSLLRGNTFAECAYLAKAGGFDGVVFAPAYPAQRRLTQGARQFVVAPSGAKEVVGGSIVEAFEALGLAAWTSAASEAPAFARRSAGALRVWVPDIGTEEDLHRVAALARFGDGPAGRWMWCGSAGLAHALASRAGVAAPAIEALSPLGAGAEIDPNKAGDVLMLGASHHAVVRLQWERLRARWPSALTVVQGDERQFEAACMAMEIPFGVAALELSPAHTLTQEAAAALLKRQMAAVVSQARKPSTLLVVGGDSLLSICRATGVERLQTLPAERAGWGHARLVGGRWDQVAFHSRSGAFGGDCDLADMLEHAIRRPAPSTLDPA